MKCFAWAVRAIAVAMLWPVVAELQNVQLGGQPYAVAAMPSLEHFAQPPEGVDLQFLERFALADDRAEILKELVPGTEAYYYFTCLYYQETGKFDEVEKLLETWVDRNGETESVREIRNRQALLRYPSAPEETLAYLKSLFGLTFNHQRQVPGEAPDLPTVLDPALISREALLKRALEDPARQDSIDGFRRSAYPWLLSADLTSTQLRALLRALTLPDYPHLPELIARDLDAFNSTGFGSMDIHKMLVREQLDALLGLKPELLDNDAFIETYLRRLRPGNDDANWQRDPVAMGAFLDELWGFAQQLAPAQTALKAHVLYHRLAFDRSQGVYDRDRFLQYIQIPRRMDYVSPAFLEKAENARFAADLAQDFSGATSLDTVRSDEALVSDYLRHFFASEKSYDAYKPYIREHYLRQRFAETKLLLGEGDMEQWYAWLDPATVDALKNRVDVAFLPENKQRFGLDEPVTLDVWVKNVDRLLVKVFAIDTKNYYQQFNQEINTAIDLDGLIANDEQVYTYSEAPLRRVRRQFTFPELTGRGVWVIEFVGNGTSSRAVVAKGALQYLSRTGPAGQVFTVFDETGKKVEDASIWFAGRTYEADEKGEITLPFSTDPGIRQFLLCQGDFAARETFEHPGEFYGLDVGFHVDSESLRAGRMATVAMFATLRLNGAIMPLSLLKDPVLNVDSLTHDGIRSSQQIADIEMRNGVVAAHQFRVPENLAQLTFTLRGTVERLTDGNPKTLRQSRSVDINGILAMQKSAGLFLSRSASGYAVELRDTSGNPLPDKPLGVTLYHKDFERWINVQLKTDSQGLVTLGSLSDIWRITAASGIDQWSGVLSDTWDLVQPTFTYPDTIQGSVQEALYLPMAGEAPEDITEVASLLEVRGDTFVADRTANLALEDGYLKLSGLAAGDYLLHLKMINRRITVRVTEGHDSGTYVSSATRVMDARAPSALQIQTVDSSADEIRIQLGGANVHTRLHIVATRFYPEPPLDKALYTRPSRDLERRILNPGYTLYTSGRQIGDEYRYILERRFAEKFPGNMLKRPSLLLNPWSIEETDASQEKAEEGEPQVAMSEAPSPPQPSEQPASLRTAMLETPFSPSYDFLDGESATLYNLVPDENGLVTIPTADLHGRNYLQIVATDPFATVSRYEALPEQSWTPRDLRLAKALDPAGHVVERKRVQVLESGAFLKVSLTGDADVQVYDSVPSVFGLMTTLNGDETLKEFSFLARWPQLSAAEKLEMFSSFESHELNFFLYHKDRAFFDGTVRPFLANKYHKTFFDQWLLEEDLSAYLQPWKLGQLNLVEKILLAKRLPDAQAAVAPWVRDAVDMIPPDPERANGLFMTALHGGALSGGAGGGGGGVEIDGAIRIRGNYYDANGSAGFGVAGNGGVDFADGGPQNAPSPAEALQQAREASAEAMKDELRSVEQDSDKIRRYIEEGKQLPEGADAKGIKQYVFRVPEIEETARAESARERYRALYRASEKTKALVETNYYKRPIEQAHAGLIPVNAFWRDYADAAPGAPFFSAHLAEAASNYTEALLALAVLDLPFDAPKHEVAQAPGDYTLQAGGAGIAYYKDIAPAGEPEAETPVLVSQNFFRADDRFRYDGNQQFDKFVTDEFLTGVVYGCQITATNPTSAPLQIEVLRQVPAGALPVNSGRYTKSERLALDPYSTARVEYFFYFPKPGDFAHYPVHVSQDGALLASAAPQAMHVVDVPTTADTESWLYISQQGTPEAVLDYLKNNNLNRIDLNLILWRMSDPAFYRQAIDLLTARLVYTPELWAYAFQHNDADAITTYLQYRDEFIAETGPAVDSALLTIAPVERKLYQHIEYAPLINPRAHHLEGKWMITNAQLARQYTALMNVIAHRPAPRPEDLLALAYYLLLQDRIGEAMQYFARLAPDQLPSRIQYDYLQAYLAFYREDPAAAATIAARYTDYPVEDWRKRFAEVAAQAAEIAGASAAAGEGRPDQDALAATEPQLDLEVNEDALLINYRNLESCEVSFYPIDLEMLFTRSPFAPAGSNIFAGVKPLATHTVALDPSKTQMDVPLPLEFAANHAVIKIEAAGISRTEIRYASNLVAQVIERYGQVQVTGEAVGNPLSGVYVKVFARMRNGQVLFYRDGYTDLRGRFDYASSSTLDIAEVDDFALLVIGEGHGARVVTAAPPAR